MVSDKSQSSALSSKDGINSASTDSDATHPPSPSDAAPSSNQPPDPYQSNHVIVRGAESSGHHGSINQDDIVIAVMGVTGTGKSSFVNKAAGRKVIEIGSNLRSQTQKIQHVQCHHPSSCRNIVLVDTPGFDDTERSDAEILRDMANWLKETYQNKIKLSGLLYLHRITDDRVAGTPLRNLSVFKDLCGDDNMKNIILVTTMWDDVDQSVGSKREQELLSDFWKAMIRLGSRTCRFQGTRESAWEIIDCLDLEGSAEKRNPLQIQQEMVDRGLQLHETTAARTFIRSLTQLAGEAKRFWTRLRNKSRRKPAAREPMISIRLRLFPSRSSTTGSSSSEADCSVVASRGSSSISSCDSTPLSSPAESTFSGCSMNGQQDTLLVAIRVLGLAHQMADIAHIPMLRGIIGTAVLYCEEQVLTSISWVIRKAVISKEMGGTHHAISDVIESSGWLLTEIAQYATKSGLSRQMKRALHSFRRELNNLQEAVIRISSRGRIAGFLLHDADVQTITTCTASIKAVYAKLEIKLAMDNRQAIARLEYQLTALLESTESRRCECGMSSAPRGGAQENGQPSVSTRQSRDF